MSRQSIERQLEELLTTPATARVRIALLNSLLETMPPTGESAYLRRARQGMYAVHGAALVTILASMAAGAGTTADGLVIPAVLVATAGTVAHHFAWRSEMKRFIAKMGEAHHLPTKLHAAQWMALIAKSPEIASEISECGLENAIRIAPRNTQEATLRRLGAGLLDVAPFPSPEEPASQEDWARLMEVIYRGGATDTGVIA